MGERSLVTIAQFSMEHEARVAIVELTDSGINAELSDGEAGAMFGNYVGTAFGGFRLQVATDDVSAAQRILGAMKSEETAGWQCGKCGVDVEAGFSVCWNCQAEAPDEAQSPGNSKVETRSEIETSTIDGTPEPAAEDIIHANDEKARQAFKTSVFSVLFAPIVFLAIPQVLRVSTLELSPTGNRRFFASLAICATVILVWFLILRM